VVSRTYLALGVIGLLVTAAGQGFYTETPFATAYNQGRHLVEDPTTGWLHIVYAYGETDVSPIYYSYSTDHGVSWSSTEEVGQGTGPCIVCEAGQVWVSYLRPNQRKIFTAARLISGPSPTWTTFEVCAGYAYSAPSMAVCHLPYPNSTAAVYVVYNWFDTNWAMYSICMNTVALPQGKIDTSECVHAVPDPAQFFAPSVTVTAGGERGPEYVHVSWCMLPTPQGDAQLWYRMKFAPPHEWDAPYRVSQPPPYEFEPAFYPSVEGFGDSVYIVWRSKEQGDPQGMVWRIQRHVEAPTPEWDYPQCVLDGLTEHANCPQQSTRWAHVWHERHTYATEDIWTNLFMCPPTSPLWEDPLQSLYPSIFAELTVVPEEPLLLYAAWTNQVQSGPHPYEVRFECDTFYPPPQDGFRSLAYYDVQVGDSVKSRYCLARDGFKRWRDHLVDFARDSLKYRLCYLNPNYDYKLMAVLFQVARDTWEQSFAFDGVPVAKVRLRPEVPETVLVYVPREAYAKDFRVDLDITKLVGDCAVLAELKVFQCYPYKRKSGGLGEDAGLASVNGPAVRLLQLGPSPFRATTSVSYVVTEPRHVDVNVYDALGRTIRCLASGVANRGCHSSCWDGLDATGRRARPGVYLLCVESDGLRQSRKVILAR
jgi:hypothetical protein